MSKRATDRRGALGALIANIQPVTPAPDGAGTPGPREVPVQQLQAGRFQPRRQFDPRKLEALAQSIREQGVLQPLVVREVAGGYEVVAGERRLRAAHLAGLEVVPCDVRELSDRQAALIAAVENLQREDLSTIDEIDATLALVAMTLDIPAPDVRARLQALNHNPEADPTAVESLEALFAQLGRGGWQSFVKNKLRVLGWPDEVLRAMREQGLKYSLASVVAGAPIEHQRHLLRLALEGASKDTLRAEAQRLTSFQKDVDLPAARRVSRALASRRALDALNTSQRSRLQQLVAELDALLGTHEPSR